MTLTKQEIGAFLKKHSGARFCLHAGFAGFCWGSPSNPIFIDFDFAEKYLMRLSEYKNDVLVEMEANVMLLDIEILYKDFPELAKYKFRFLGLNRPSECLYGDAGLG